MWLKLVSFSFCQKSIFYYSNLLKKEKKKEKKTVRTTFTAAAAATGIIVSWDTRRFVRSFSLIV